MEQARNDRAIARFTMLGHALVHWFETSVPIFLVVWLAEFDVTVVLFGLVVALGYAPFGLGALPAGVLTDIYGSKRLVLVSIVGMSLGFLVVAATSTIVGIAVGLLLWGIAASLYHPAGLSLISTGVSDRGSVFAYHGIAGNAGIALGPFVTASLLVVLDWQAVALVLTLPGVVATAYGLRAEFDPTAAADVASETADDPFSLRSFLADSRVLFASAFALVFVLVTFEGLFYRGTLTYLPEILHDLPAMAAIDVPSGLEGIEPSDYLYVGLLVVGMAGQYAGGKATNRLPTSYGLVGIFVVLAVLAAAFLPTADLGAGALIVLCGLLGFFLFAIQPFYQDAVALWTPADTRGLSYGFTYLGEFGFGATSVAVGGFVLGTYSVAAFFAVLAGFALVGGLLSVALYLVVGGE